MLRPPSRETDWNDRSLTELVSHIIARYHIPLREELIRLGGMLEKVTSSYGTRHRELEAVASLFGFLADEIEPHMEKEEAVIFPHIQRLELLHRRRSNRVQVPPSFEKLQKPISILEPEHETVGEVLGELRRLTRNYQEPPDACQTYRALFHGIAELDRELQEHIHIENNLLFPRAVELEKELHFEVIAN